MARVTKGRRTIFAARTLETVSQWSRNIEKRSVFSMHVFGNW